MAAVGARRSRSFAALLAGALVTTAVAGSTAGAAASAAPSSAFLQVITRDGVPMIYVRGDRAVAAHPAGQGATRSDFDGDGIDDLAIAAGSTDVSASAGANHPLSSVTVTYSTVAHQDTFVGVMQGSSAGSAFGTALTTGDFNRDGYDDLVIGDPDEDVPGTDLQAGGSVWIMLGGPEGLRAHDVQHYTQDTPNIPGVSETLDWWGSSLAAGDLNGDGYDDLAVGAYAEKVGSAAQAGAVTVLFGNAGGVKTSGSIGLTQNSTGVPGSVEKGDRFGHSLAIGRVNRDAYADLIIGAPRENGTPFEGAGYGSVTLLWGAAGGPSGSNATSVTGAQVDGAVGVDGTFMYELGSQVGVTDTNGDGLGEVISSTGLAQVGWTHGAGAVASIPGRTTGLSARGTKVFSQAGAVPGAAEAGDFCGGSLAVGDVTGDGRGDVLLGCPGEATGSAGSAGAIVLLRGSSGGLTTSGSRTITQNSAGVPGSAEAGDRFGQSLAVLNLDGVGALDVIVGSPREVVTGDQTASPSGTVTTFRSSGGELVPTTSWSGRSATNAEILGLIGYGASLT
jgi:hypothetical protein